MDRLTRNAMLAKKAGMSYGKWKAMQPPVDATKTIPDGWKACEYCGKPFPPKAHQRFCEYSCREASQRERKWKEQDAK